MGLFLSHSRAQRRHPPHDATIAGLAVHFTLTTRVNSPLDVATASRRMLRRDLAVTAAWPSEPEIRVSHRFHRSRRELSGARSLQADAHLLAAHPGLASSLRFALRHPRFASKVLEAAWASWTRAHLERLIEHPTPVAVGWFLMRHPIYGRTHVLPALHRIGRTAADRRSTPEQAPPTASDQIDDSAAAEDYAADNRTSVDRALDEAEQTILDQQAVSAAERTMDADLFGGRDRDEDRFVRLLLRSSAHHLVLPGDTGATQEVILEPRLLLHESGVSQLTLRLSIDKPLTTGQVVALTWSPEPVITRSEMAESLLTGYSWASPIEWAPDLDAGERLGQIDHQHPVAVADLLVAHLRAVEAAIGTRVLGDWTIYPTAIVRIGDCCGPNDWQQNHLAEVRNIVGRYRGSGPLTQAADPGRDFSLHDDHSLYVTLGSATYLQWRGKPPTGLPELDTTLVLEYGQFLYARLLTLESAVTRFRLNDRHLKTLYRDAIVLFSELRQGNLRSGTTRDIAAHLLRELGGDAIRSTVETGLQLSGSAQATVSAARASRRSLRLTLIGTAVAVLVAVPPVNEVLAAVAATPDDGSYENIVAPLRAAADLGLWGAWVVLATLLALFLIGAVLRKAASLRHLRIQPQRRGPAWPTLINVTAIDNESDIN